MESIEQDMSGLSLDDEDELNLAECSVDKLNALLRFGILDLNSEETVLAMLERKADVNEKDMGDSGHTPLHLAVQKGNKEIVNLLLEHKADLDAQDLRLGTPLHDAAWKSSTLTKLFLEKGASVNAKTVNNRTPLHIAAANGKVNATRYLVEHGSELDVLDVLKETALDKFLARGQQEISTFLIFSGARCCLAKSGPLAEQYALEHKLLLLADLHRNWPSIPNPWKPPILEFLCTMQHLREQHALSLPKELSWYITELIFLLWPFNFLLTDREDPPNTKN
eukprot:TRINITY_DN24981_c0_g1_i1.p1 TRINITY_DN24981_c0_g1~~TRINITY_DN24981_c0_g1_i1.p1  ORF type:complete len:280 (+),score=77.47 TRINITY_DN24981_c0_g1_i1:31-870(+)